MMRTIARRFSEGGFTLPALAAELNMTQDALLERLFMMERFGYVVRSGGCEEKPHTETPSCCCSGCSCSGGGIVGYALTEKGKRLAGVKARGT